MRVAIIHSAYREAVSGENRAVDDQARLLADAGIQVKLITRASPPHPGITYITRSAARTLSGHGVNPLETLGRFKPDVVHVHNLFPNWSTAWLSKVKAPLVTTLHNFRSICAAGTLSRNGTFCDLCPTLSSANAILKGCYQHSPLASVPLAVSTARPARNQILAQSRRLLVLSESALRTYSKYLPQAVTEKMTVFPNFAAPRTRHLKPDSVRNGWLFAGRVSEEKGILALIRDWPPGESLTVLGDGPALGEARELAEKKTVYFEGAVPQSRVHQKMLESEGLIFPSLCQENHPTVILEALSSGLPVIALAGNDGARMVEVSGGGIVLPNFSGVQGGLEIVRSRGQSMAIAGQRMVEKEFSPEAWLTRLLAIYHDLKADSADSS